MAHTLVQNPSTSVPSHSHTVLVQYSHPVRCSLLAARCTIFLIHHSPCIPASSDTTTTTTTTTLTTTRQSYPLLYPLLFIFIPTLLTTLTTSNTVQLRLTCHCRFLSPPPPSFLILCRCHLCIYLLLLGLSCIRSRPRAPPSLNYSFFDFFCCLFLPAPTPLFFFPLSAPILVPPLWWWWWWWVAVGACRCLDRCGSFSLTPFFLPSFLPSFHPPSPLQPSLPFSSSVTARVSSVLLSSPPPPFSLSFVWEICYRVGCRYCCCRHHFYSLL